MENMFPEVKRYEVFTGNLSKRSIYIYEKASYKKFKTEHITEGRDRIYLEKVK